MATQQSLGSFADDPHAITLQDRRCLDCEAAVRVRAQAQDRNIVIRMACPECGELTKLIPVDPEPTWLVDGEPTAVPDHLQYEY